ncbi:FG-GAP repeat domain-containing protein [Candidatus Electronema sp. PJ]|uniref:FG-GAP repeat domain-containing protein n=1 Tax=Candidatus Electronema sp. PJ TaxID=3401572 RepID=UPI003AA9A048
MSHRFLLPIILLLLAVLLPAHWVSAKDTATKPGQIVFLPFTVTTQPPQEHLRTGLTNILATRLSERTGLTAVHGADKTSGLEEMLHQGNQQEAKKMLKNMQSDYLLFGSLEQQQSGYTIVIHVFRNGKSKPATFTRTVTALDRALPALDELASEIVDKVFQQKALQAETDSLPLPADKTGMDGFQTAHPDKAWRDGLYALGQESAASSLAGNGPFKIFNAQSSGEMAISLRAMDAGDLDSDGREELVLLEQGRLLLCRFSSDRFQQIAELALPGHLAYHAVYLASLNKNDHRSQIYISASNGSIPSSLVLAWDGKKFFTLHEQIPFYLRPDIDSAGKPVLLGQSGQGIYRMSFNQEGTLDRTEEVDVPQGISLYDFIRADLDQDGRREFIALTNENNLLILDQEGKPLWKSTEIYGASRDALGTLASRRQAELDHPYDRERLYIHTRLIAQDVTGDGKPEIIIGRNRVTNVDYFKNLRWFEGSSVAVLSWDGSQMQSLWESSQIPGYTVDYQLVRSTEQPGRFRLFAAESDDSGNPLYFWAKEKTVIRMQELMKQ